MFYTAFTLKSKIRNCCKISLRSLRDYTEKISWDYSMAIFFEKKIFELINFYLKLKDLLCHLCYEKIFKWGKIRSFSQLEF